MKNNTKNYIIGGVVLLLIVLTISVSYAYFHARILGNDEALENSFKVGKLELSFVDDNYISLLNVKPGSSDSKTFSVENTSTLDDPITYNIKLSEITNNFVRRDLKYTLEEYPDASFDTPKEDGLKVEGYINTDSVQNNEMYLAVNIPGPIKGAKQYYKLTIDFQELNMPQDYNQNASFEGKVNVDSEEDMKLYVQEPNAPELYQGMIPVYFNDGKIYIANVDAKWYDYDNNEWANAVLINYTDPTTKAKFYDGDKLKINQEVSEYDILQMYVWIPRYRYKLFNVEGNIINPQEIKIEFEKDTETTGNVSCKYINKGDGTIEENCKNAENGNWYTHPAFTFGNTELKGFWVGKFEVSHITKSNLTGTSAALNCTNDSCDEADYIRIIPNAPSLRYNSISNFFYVSRSIEKPNNIYNLDSDEIDTHMIKNTEWGAVAYLTQSKYGRFNSDGNEIKDGAEVWVNNDLNYTTGCAGSSVTAGQAACTNEFKWTQGGVHASTTNNASGIYDMAGGAFDSVMGNMVNSNGEFYSSGAGFSTEPDSKYYDIYTYVVSSDITIGHLGDATRETRSWYDDFAVSPSSSRSWFSHGGYYNSTVGAGVFSPSDHNGPAVNNNSFHLVLSAA